MPNSRKIERLYAWIATQPDGEALVMLRASPRDPPRPMIGGRMEMERCREGVRAMQRIRGWPVRLVCFDHLVEIERLPFDA